MKGTGVGKRRRGRWLGRLLTAHGLGGYLFLYLPIFILIVFSFNDSRYAAAWRGFTTRWYATLFADESLGMALRNSLIVAGTSTLISTVFGTMVALAMERYNFWGKLAFDALLYLPIIIPDIAMAVMLLLFFVLTRVHLGTMTIIVSHVAFNISFVAVVVRARLAYFDITLEEAAQDLYANEWQTFRRVTLPLIMPGILGGALLAFTLSLDDFVITFFTAGPGSSTLPLRIYSMVKLGVTPEINALSSMMLIVSMMLVMLSLFLQRGGGKGIKIA
ncbi:MAG: ABC transporter permease [Anaerolineae bacterium]|jgi:spermidine/putrescine transport system permease protein|nr:ABC transporter permease [Anaerolineae bacterium]MDH7473888.1 ABC transporter permease [Anaerolineae bacterium]